MILLTLNVRGLASLSKKLAVIRLINQHAVDVIFLQETMIEGCVLVQDLEHLIHGWQFISVMLRVDRVDLFWAESLVIFFFIMPRP